MWSYVPKLDVLLLSNSFTHCFFTYITSATSSDEMELWSSLDNSLHFQTLNFFSYLPYLISCSRGKKTMPLPYAIPN